MHPSSPGESTRRMHAGQRESLSRSFRESPRVWPPRPTRRSPSPTISTHRQWPLVTGHERDDKEESALDYKALAAFPGTLVFYMGVKWAGRWSSASSKTGKPPDTPVAVVQWCTRARQQTAKCTLETVVDAIGEKGIRPPSLFVVGKVVDHAPTLSWFQERPLFGTSVLVAGSKQTAAKLRSRLSVLGAEVLTQPAIRIAEPVDWAPVDSALDQIQEYDWMVFTSGNGVDGFMGRVLGRGNDARTLGGVRLAALGKGTAERLQNYHLNPDLAPPGSTPPFWPRTSWRRPPGPSSWPEPPAIVRFWLTSWRRWERE